MKGKTRIHVTFVFILVLTLSLLPFTADARTVVDTTTLITKSYTGKGGDASSYYPSISADGTKIAFQSTASNLVGAITTSGTQNIFLYDVVNDTTTLVSAGSSGGGGDGLSLDPSISADGTKIAFGSQAGDLVGAETPVGESNIFLYDIAQKTTTWITVTSSDTLGSFSPSISADGTKIAFESYVSDFPGAETLTADSEIFVYDSTTEKISLVSVRAPGASGGDGGSYEPSISADGTKVVFTSLSTDLIGAPATSERSNIFYHDLNTKVTTLVTAGASGSGGNMGSYRASVSGDGSRVTFYSYATDLPGAEIAQNCHIFVYDVTSGKTTLIDVNTSGIESNGPSFNPSITRDGSMVVFDSYANDLAEPRTTPGRGNVYIHDLAQGTTTLITPGIQGTGGNDSSRYPSISDDGTKVAFQSWADNLITTETGDRRTGDIYLWTRATYVDVTFDSQNGSEQVTETILPGIAVAAPTEPIRDGFVFNGWWTAPIGGVQWDFTDPVTRDMTLYAQWLEKFTVTFNAQNETMLLTVEVIESLPLIMPPDPIKEGFFFMGWWTHPIGGVLWDFENDVVLGNMTLYGHWISAEVPPIGPSKPQVSITPRTGDGTYIDIPVWCMLVLGLAIIIGVLAYWIVRRNRRKSTAPIGIPPLDKVVEVEEYDIE